MRNRWILSGILLGLLSATAVASEKAGDWRGHLELAPGVSLVLGIEIIAEGDGYNVVLDSPNQGMVDHQVEDVKFDGHALTFNAPELNASFAGTFDHNTLTGKFTQGRAFDITLGKLTKDSAAMLVNESLWFGDLQIAPQSTLPLVLGIGVTNEGYHATLDSPQQQSFGIPLTDFRLSDKEISFNSPMIGASYRGEFKNGEWVGTFVQGAAMPLTLKKSQG